MNRRVLEMFGPFLVQGVVAVSKMLLVLGLLFLPGAADCAFATIHPVQLERSTDDAKCLECHEDKVKGKVIHPAVNMGCLTCHSNPQHRRYDED